jgi:hypothetical protein
MENTTDTMEIQNSEATRPTKRKAGKPRHHRPYKSISGASLETRIVDITKKMHLWEAKVQTLRDKLKQHNDELLLRETPSAAS